MNTGLNNAPRIIFGNDARVQDFTLILSTKALKHLGQIINVPSDSITYSANFNSADELSFTVYKEMNSQKESLWDDIKQFSIVWVKELNQYFEITFSKTQKNDISKEIVCTSLCEAELSQINLYGLEINTQEFYDDYAEVHKDEDYELPVYIFYNDGTFGENKKSLLDAIIEKAPHYSIGHVDDSLKNLQRTFSVDGTSIYDFMIGDLAKEFNCAFQFDTTTRTINVYDLYSVCEDVNCDYYINENRQYYNNIKNPDPDFDHKFYREEGITECPYCGNKHLYYFGNDTTIFVEQNALTDEINFSTDTDAVKNCFKLESGDEYMTDTVKNINYGSDYIMHFSDEMKSMMSDELVNAIESYEQEVSTYQEQYVEINEHIYELEDDLIYYESSMMPTVKTDDTDAEQEAAKLTSSALSPISLQYLTSTTSKTSADNAVKNYALVYVTPGRFKVEINNSNWTPGNNTGTWTGTLKVTNYSDGDDVAITNSITITFNKNYQNFLEQKIAKQIYNNASKSDSSSIWGVLYTYNANTGKYTPVTKADFVTACTKYSLNRLESFYNSIETGLEVLTETGQGSEGSEAYSTIYLPLKDKLDVCQEAIDVRESQISDVNSELGYYETDENGNNPVWNEWTKTTDGNTKPYKQRRQEIQEHLSFDAWLKSRNLYDEFCSFRREDTYSNSNFISDLYYENDDNSGLMERAQEFLKQANTELIKSSTAQHSINANLYNLLIMKDFQPLIKNFQLGNFIRVKCENDIYRMRLLHYEIDFGNINNLSTQFSDMTYVGSVVSDLQSVIDSSKQMATSYSSVSKQSESGQEASNTLSDIRKQGLNATLYEIKSKDTEEIVIDSHGILGRSYDDITDSYDDKQIRINSNVIAFTDDNWQTVKMAIGNTSYVDKVTGKTYTNKYGVNADFFVGDYIEGIKIVGTDYYGLNNNGTLNGFHINTKGDIYTGIGSRNYLKADGTLRLGDGKITYNGTTLNVSGDITANTLTATESGTIGPWKINSNALYRNNSTFGASDGIYFGASGISLTDKFKVTSDGALTATNANITGAITATSGTFTGTINATGNINSGSTITSSTIIGSTIQNESGTFSVSANGDIVGANISGASFNNTGGIYKFAIDKNGYLIADYAKLNHADIEDATLYRAYIPDQLLVEDYSTITLAKGGGAYNDVVTFNVVSDGYSYFSYMYINARVVFQHHIESASDIFIRGNGICLSSDGGIRTPQSSHTANMYWNPDNGYIYKSTTGSSKRYKHDITTELDEKLDPYNLYNLDIVQFKYNKDFIDDGEALHIGFIAEDVEKVYPVATEYSEPDEDGNTTVENWFPREIIPAMLKLIQEQKKQIDSLEERISQLEKLINKL